MVEGEVRILEDCGERVQVFGDARVDTGGTLYAIKGWINKREVT